jgi:hypothetical protein
MRTNPTPPRNIDDYIAAYPHEVQAALEMIRTTIRKAAPKAFPGLLAIASFCVACETSQPDHVTAIQAIHSAILRAHREGDPEGWTALEADTVTVASRGELFLASRAERLDQRRAYLGSTRFSVYRDIQPPLVRVAGDGSQAWLFANVEVVAHNASGAGDSTHTIWAWIELYEHRKGKWLLVGNVSNERPGPVE